MKRKLYITTILSLAVLLLSDYAGWSKAVAAAPLGKSVKDATTKALYVLTVFPSNDARRRHENVRAALRKWMKNNPDVFQTTDADPFVDPATGKNYQEFSSQRSGANLFTANLTEDQAASFRDKFTTDDGHSLLVHLNHDFVPSPATIDKDSEKKLYGVKSVSKTWAMDLTVPSAINISASGYNPAPGPVLYVVDSGVQPIIPAQAPYQWHPEFAKASGTTPSLIFLQGRISQCLGYSWQYPGDPAYPVFVQATGNALPAPWNVNADTSLSWTGNTLAPASGYDTSTYLDPQIDSIPHGTLITSCAIGVNVGILGRVTVNGNAVPVRVESIKIYSGSITSTASATEGIFRAVDAHLQRQGVDSNPNSVLLFASRTTSGFDPSLEAALWWAWYNNVICVVSAGNEPNPYMTSPTKAYPPDKQWFPADNAPQPTSPSRFDWTVGQTQNGQTYWNSLGFTDLNGNAVPPPTQYYLIMAGADNAAYGAQNDGWVSTSSSIGPGVDVIAPSVSVPCAKNATSSVYNAGEDLVLASGASLSTGYIAGAALAYAGSRANPTPLGFNQWLLPSTAPTNAAPIKLSTHATAQPGSALPSSYGNPQKMPILYITNNTTW